MKILFALNHPAHYYLFKYIIKKISSDYKIYIVIRDKDVLSELFTYQDKSQHTASTNILRVLRPSMA